MPRKAYADEKRESRISLLVTKSFSEQINLLANSQGLTTNDFIIRQLQRVVTKNANVIEKFRKAQQEAQQNFMDVDIAADDSDK